MQMECIIRFLNKGKITQQSSKNTLTEMDTSQDVLFIVGRFKRYYAALFGQDVPEADEVWEKTLQFIGTERDGRIGVSI